jgi:hypothetical protein
MNVNVAGRVPAASLMDTFVAFLMMLLIEPFLLAFLGTTPGKWILGLEVVDHDGKFLSVSEGFSRTWTVFWSGFGFCIPIYNLVRQWKCYNACKEGEILDWEHESALVLKDEKKWRTAIYVVANIMLFIVLVYSLKMAGLPKHRGDITVAAFSENYNRLSSYFKIDKQHMLDESGRWVKREYDGTVIIAGSDFDLPEFRFAETDGIMTGLRFSVEHTNYEGMLPTYQNEMILSVLSFVGAQKSGLSVLNDINEMVNLMTDFGPNGIEANIQGVSVKYSTEISGYYATPSLGMYWPIEGEKKHFRFEFEMVK